MWGEHKTILIPWDNFQRCGWDIGYIGGLDGVVTGLFEPFTLGLFTPDYAYTWVNYWDEYYGTNFVLSFRIGPHYLKNRAIQLARDILAAHGKYRQKVRQVHTVIRQG
ncbi:MAG: hypothetical protein M5U29_02605 [Anaerolineae bacterium]|nr:hypothetical protein [Anaerolineae bacterium]